MSNILERHLEQNIDPTNQTRESYIDQAIQIFTDMKEEDITKMNDFKHGNKYCLCGLLSRMTGYTGIERMGFAKDVQNKIGFFQSVVLSKTHYNYCYGKITFEQMRQQAIQYMESLK